MPTIASSPIFVVSSPRSGSTLFRLLIDAHPRIGMAPPAWLYDYFHPFLYSYGDLAREENLLALAKDLIDAPTIAKWPISMTPAELVEIAAEPSFRGLYDALHRRYAEKSAKTRWGEKTPRNAFWMDEIAADFPDALFIHLIRDGRDTALDIANAPFFPETIYSAAKLWTDSVKAATDSGNRLPKGSYYEIHYEALCENPATELEKLCDFMGEAFAPEMLLHHERKETKTWSQSAVFHRQVANPISTEFCGIYRALSAEDLAIVESVQYDFLKKFGYPVDGSRKNVPPRLAEQFAATDVVTGMDNAEFKHVLHERRNERLQKGIWRREDRPTQLWSAV